jgi:hypothetical protein
MPANCAAGSKSSSDGPQRYLLRHLRVHSSQICPPNAFSRSLSLSHRKNGICVYAGLINLSSPLHPTSDACECRTSDGHGTDAADFPHWPKPFSDIDTYCSNFTRDELSPGQNLRDAAPASNLTRPQICSGNGDVPGSVQCSQSCGTVSSPVSRIFSVYLIDTLPFAGAHCPLVLDPLPVRRVA